MNKDHITGRRHDFPKRGKLLSLVLVITFGLLSPHGRGNNVGGEASLLRQGVGGEASLLRHDVGGEASLLRQNVGGEASLLRQDIGGKAYNSFCGDVDNTSLLVEKIIERRDNGDGTYTVSYQTGTIKMNEIYAVRFENRIRGKNNQRITYDRYYIGKYL